MELEFEGFTPTDLTLNSNGEPSFCGFHYVPADALPDTHAELEEVLAQTGFRTIDALDPANNNLEEGALRAFLDSNEDGSNYIVIDNFAE